MRKPSRKEIDVLHIVSTLVLALIVLGLLNRRRPQWHLPFMVSAFMVDFVLVLYIELTRGAVERVAGGTETLVWFHAGISTAVLACYVGMMVLGRRLLRQQTAFRNAHMKLGITFCVLRSLNYVTSFMI